MLRRRSAYSAGRWWSTYATEKGTIELVNPVIVEQSGLQDGNEGCLSAPGEWCRVERPMRVTVKAFDRTGKEITIKGNALLARAICHELDHLEGVLFTDRVKQDIPERAEGRR